MIKCALFVFVCRAEMSAFRTFVCSLDANMTRARLIKQNNRFCTTHKHEARSFAYYRRTPPPPLQRSHYVSFSLKLTLWVHLEHGLNVKLSTARKRNSWNSNSVIYLTGCDCNRGGGGRGGGSAIIYFFENTKTLKLTKIENVLLV